VGDYILHPWRFMTYTINPIYLSGYLGTSAFRTDLKATSVREAIANVGERLDAVDGAVSYLHRAYKRQWDIMWDLVIYSGSVTYPLATVLGLKRVYTALALSGTAMVFGMDGLEYQVIPDMNTWSAELRANNVSLTSIPYYSVSFKVIEI